MSTPASPRPAGDPEQDAGDSRPARPWKAATAIAVVLGLGLSAGVYVVMDQRLDDARAERDAARDELEREREQGLAGLADLLGGLTGQGEDGESGLGGLLGDGGLGDLLGEGGLGELLGGEGGLEGLLGDVDPVLFECLGDSVPGSGGDIPDGDVESQVAAIQQIIADERGLPASGQVDIEFVSLDEVRRRAVDLTSAELDSARAAVDARMLAALGAVEPGTDLAQAQLDALDAGVGGFYDPKTKQLVIGAEEMDGLGMMVTAHELVHAMADDALGLPDQEAIAASAGADAAYAALNAIEGDASLYGQRFVSQHLPLDQLLALQAMSSQTTADLDELPHFVSRQLEFPYLEGMTFTCHTFLDGGWDAVDATYSEPPTTTAQILFPDRYRAGEGAVDVRDPAGPDGWRQLRSDTFGAADLLFLLEAPGDDEDAALSDPVERVSAWAGGEITAWGRGDATAAAVVLADRGGATPLCDTVSDFYAAAFPDASRSGAGAETVFEGSAQSAVVACQGDEVALGIGPDVATARATVD